MKKLLIVVGSIFILLFGAYGAGKIYKIITRFEYDKVETISFIDSQSQDEACYYVFYTLDNDKLTDFAIGDIYELDKSSCEIYVVNMNELENQKYMNSELKTGIYIDSLPILVKYENGIITDIQKLKKV